MKSFFLRFVFVFAVFLAGASLVRSEDLGVVRARMEKRVSQIDALKSTGVLGEDNRGFLAVRSGSDGGFAAVENADRAVVYAALAHKTGTSAEAVGSARAKQLANTSAKGVWVQAENGQWHKK